VNEIRIEIRTGIKSIKRHCCNAQQNVRFKLPQFGAGSKPILDATLSKIKKEVQVSMLFSDGIQY